MNTAELALCFRCPRSGGELRRQGDKLVAISGGEAIEYDVIDGCPVLIDFEDSVLRRADIGSSTAVVTRRAYAGLLGLAKRIVSPRNSTTKRNVELLMSSLHAETDRPRVLIVGGGTVGQGMESFYAEPRISLAAFDIYLSPHVQFVADAHHIPLEDGCFDAVIVQAVLEHVLEPRRVVSEIQRVLKPNGLVYAETPFLQHVHEGAYDFTRFTESGHRYLFRQFELIRSGATAGAGTQLLWSVDYLVRGLFRSRLAGKITKLLCFWLQYLDLLIPKAYNIDAASGVYFYGRKQDAPIDPPTIIAHYQGAQ